MRLSYLFVANRAIKDEVTRKYSFLDLFSIIRIKKNEPIGYQNFVVGGKIIDVSAGNLKVDIRIIDPLGTVIDTAHLEGDVIEGDVQIAAQFRLTKFETLGRHYIKLAANGTDLDDDGRFFFDVTKEV